MKFNVGEEVSLIDGTRAKVVGIVSRRAGEHAHRMVQFENGLGNTFHISELLPAEAADAAEPVKPSKSK